MLLVLLLLGITISFAAGLILAIIASIGQKPDWLKTGVIMMIGPTFGFITPGVFLYLTWSYNDRKAAEVFDPKAYGRYVLGVCSGDSLNPVYNIQPDSSRLNTYCYLNINSDHTFSIENAGKLKLPKSGSWESIVPWQDRVIQFEVTDSPSFGQQYLYGISKEACSKGYWSIELYNDKSTWADEKQLPGQWAFFRKMD